MRLAVVAEQLRAPVPGGTGRYTRELIDALTANAQMRDQITQWQAPFIGRLGRAGRPALAELWRRRVGPAPRHADCVFSPTPLAPPRRGRPLIVTIHDAVPWTHPETLTPRGARWHREIAARIAAEADVVLTPTAAVAAELREHLTLRRVEVVGEGVNPQLLTVPLDADERAQRLRLPPAYALAVGTLEPRKGLDVAAAALQEEAWPVDLPLVLVGPDGWGGVSLPAGMQVLGRLGDQDLATVYSRASVLVMPSRAEGFGLPVLEAMAHGLPVVISDAPALVETAGGAAVVVPRGDAAALASGVGRALADRAALSAAGLVRSRAFSWDTSATHVWDICRQLVFPETR
ncbi:MAG: glycosyl transferase group 1 [Mycobacterium sp.]|nr:glycosyl transferase group 1 [Mycobacterium sp.]